MENSNKADQAGRAPEAGGGIAALLEAIKNIDTKIRTEEARQTPMPITQRAQLVLRHLRRAREALADAKLALRLAAVELERPAKPRKTSAMDAISKKVDEAGLYDEEPENGSKG